LARGHRGGIFTISTSAPKKAASNEAVNWPVRVVDQELEVVGSVVEVPERVAS
jgi:hypothetical protein